MGHSLPILGVPGVLGGGASVPFVPTDIASLAFWAKADAGVYTDAAKATPATNGQLVYTWVDQKGGADLVQATEGNRPTFNTNQINGLPALTFAGTHFMNSTFDLNNGYTAVYVLFTTDGTTNKYACSSSAVYNNYIYVLANRSVRLNAGTTVFPFPSGSYPLSTTVCAYVTYAGANTNIELNGIAGTPGDAGTTALTNLRVGAQAGGTEGWIGQTAEVLYFSEVLSAPNKAALYAYISARYGITFP